MHSHLNRSHLKTNITEWGPHMRPMAYAAHKTYISSTETTEWGPRMRPMAYAVHKTYILSTGTQPKNMNWRPHIRPIEYAANETYVLSQNKYEVEEKNKMRCQLRFSNETTNKENMYTTCTNKLEQVMDGWHMKLRHSQ